MDIYTSLFVVALLQFLLVAKTQFSGEKISNVATDKTHCTIDNLPRWIRTQNRVTLVVRCNSAVGIKNITWITDNIKVKMEDEFIDELETNSFMCVSKVEKGFFAPGKTYKLHASVLDIGGLTSDLYDVIHTRSDITGGTIVCPSSYNAGDMIMIDVTKVAGATTYQLMLMTGIGRRKLIASQQSSGHFRIVGPTGYSQYGNTFIVEVCSKDLDRNCKSLSCKVDVAPTNEVPNYSHTIPTNLKETLFYVSSQLDITDDDAISPQMFDVLGNDVLHGDVSLAQITANEKQENNGVLAIHNEQIFTTRSILSGLNVGSERVLDLPGKRVTAFHDIPGDEVKVSDDAGAKIFLTFRQSLREKFDHKHVKYVIEAQKKPLELSLMSPVSSTVDVSFFNPTTNEALTVRNLSTPVSIHFVLKNVFADVLCVYWSHEAKAWSTYGVQTHNQKEHSVECRVNHFSTYTVVHAYQFYNKDHNVAKMTGMIFGVIIAMILIIIFIIFIALRIKRAKVDDCSRTGSRLVSRDSPAYSNMDKHHEYRDVDNFRNGVSSNDDIIGARPGTTDGLKRGMP